MALLQNDKVIFYHPLDDAVEAVEAKTWAGSADFTDGKVERSMCPAAGADADLSGLTADYGNAAGAAKMAFAGWFCNPSGEGAGAPSAGPEYVSDPGPPNHVVNIVSAAALDSSKFVFLWQDGGTGDARAIIGAVSGTAVSFGSANSVEAADAESVSAAALSPTAFLACYTDAANHDLSVAVGTVSGLDITFGAPHRLTSTAHDIQCVSLTSTLAVCTFRHDTDAATVALTVSGTDITFSPLQEPGSGRSLCVAALTSTTFIQIYRAASFGNRGRARVGTVTGGTVTFGSDALFSENDNNHPIGEFGFVCALDSTHVVVVYTPSSGRARAVVGVVAGATVSFGGWVTFGSSTSTKLKCEALDPTHFAVVVLEGSVLNSRVGRVSGEDIILSPSKKANSGAASGGWLNGQAVARLDAGKFVVVYADTATGKGRAQIFTAPSERPTLGSPIGDGAEGAGGTGVNGSTIEVYVNGQSVGTADGTVSGGEWAKTGMSAVSEGDTVKARQTEPGKPKSGFSNVVVVASAPSELYYMGWANPTTWLGGSPAAAPPMSVCSLDTEHMVVLWRDDDGNAKVIAGFLSYGYHITWGSAVTIGTADAESVSVVALSATKVLACYTDATNGNLAAAVGTVSGDTDITVGPVEKNLYDATRIQCVALAPGLAVCTFTDPGFATRSYVQSIAVSGTGIAFGTAKYLTVTAGSSGFVAGLTSTTFVHMYRDAAGGRARVGTVAGITITYAAAAGFTANAIGDYGFVCALNDPTRFVVVYEDVDDSSKGKAVIGTVSGADVTFGAPRTFCDSAVTKLKCVALDSARFVAAAYDASEFGEFVGTWVGVVSGTDITFGFATRPCESADGWMSGQTMARLHSGPSVWVVIVYSDIEDSNRGKARVGDDHTW